MSCTDEMHISLLPLWVFIDLRKPAAWAINGQVVFRAGHYQLFKVKRSQLLQPSLMGYYDRLYSMWDSF